MAAKQSKQDKVAADVREDSRRSDAGDAPFSGDVKSPDELRGQAVVKPVETSFDERTGAGTPPWQREDGSQDNGAADTTSETK